MSIVLKNATLVDTAAKNLRPNSTVIVSNSKVEQVTQSLGKISETANVVDCKGKFLVPGLMDMHVHLQTGLHKGPTTEEPVPTLMPTTESESGLISRLHSYLYCGVTAIYDAGNIAQKIFFLRDAERSGRIQSPRIFCAGNIVTCPGGHGAQVATEIASLPFDKQKLEEHLAKNPDIVKITYDEHNWGVRPLIPILDLETLRRIIDHCHSKKFRVTVHTSNEIRSREAVSCGADSLAHPVIQSPVTHEFIWLLTEKKIPVVSTLTIGENYSRLAEHPEFLDQSLYRDCFDEEERERLKTEESQKQKTNRWAMWMKIMTPVAQDNLKRLLQAGGIVVTGTDASSGPAYHRELELLQDGGISPFDIIIAATRNAAIYLGEEKELGAIEPGKLADFILVDEDPTKDVDNLKRTSLVVKGGQIVDRSNLDLQVNKQKAPLVRR